MFTDVHPDRKLALARELRIASSANYCRLLLVDLEKRSTTTLVERGFGAQFVGPRWISYVCDSNLYIVEVDLEKRRVLGEPSLLQAGVANESLFGQVQYAISDAGFVAFVPGGDRSVGRLTWIDRNGGSEVIPVPPALYGRFDLTPDGRRLVVEVCDVEDSIRVLDLDRGELRKLGIRGQSRSPIWVQGSRIFFNWRRDREDRFKVVSTNDVGQDLVTVRDSDKNGQFLLAASWDGKIMATFDRTANEQTLSIAGTGTEKKFDASASSIRSEGDWYAFGSERTGRFETWVTPISDLTKERQVSVEGGVEPRFCRACPWLFYRWGTRFYGVRMPSAGSDWGPPELHWRTDFIDTNGRSFDVSPDGQRLLVSRTAVPEVTDRIHLIQNWQALLAKDAEPARR